MYQTLKVPIGLPIYNHNPPTLQAVVPKPAKINTQESV